VSAARAALAIRGLYAVTPDVGDTQRLVGMVRSALDGGVRLFQYRNKTGDAALRLQQARALKTVCALTGAVLIVNDHVELAVEVDADGVHLGGEDASAHAARQALGPDKLLGISCYRSVELARAAVRDGADHVAFGSFFPSRVKPDAVRAPLELLVEAKRELTVPIVAIGGITSETARRLVSAGADAVAVISDIFQASDIEAAAARYASVFNKSHE
jgi:thiamine-phosphate pyrophosphorylase